MNPKAFGIANLNSLNADADLPATGRIDVPLGEKRTNGAYQIVIGIARLKL